MKMKLLIVGVASASILICSKIHSFVYDVEPNHLWEINGEIEYARQQREHSQDPRVSFSELMERQDHHKFSIISWVDNELLSVFEIFDSPSGINSDNYERQ